MRRRYSFQSDLKRIPRDEPISAPGLDLDVLENTPPHTIWNQRVSARSQLRMIAIPGPRSSSATSLNRLLFSASSTYPDVTTQVRETRKTNTLRGYGVPHPMPVLASAQFRRDRNPCSSTLGIVPTDRSLLSFRGFDLPSPTCYKNPFCAVVCLGPVVPPFPKAD